MSISRFIRFGLVVLVSVLALGIGVVSGQAVANVLSPATYKSVSGLVEPNLPGSAMSAWLVWKYKCPFFDLSRWDDEKFMCTLTVKWGEGTVVGQNVKSDKNYPFACTIVGDVYPGGIFKGGYLACEMPSILAKAQASGYPYKNMTGYEKFPELTVLVKGVQWDEVNSQPYLDPTYGNITPIMTHPSGQIGILSQSGINRFEAIFLDQVVETNKYAGKVSRSGAMACLSVDFCDVRFILSPYQAKWNALPTNANRQNTYAWWVDDATFYIGLDPVTGSQFWGSIERLWVDPQVINTED